MKTYDENLDPVIKKIKEIKRSYLEEIDVSFDAGDPKSAETTFEHLMHLSEISKAVHAGGVTTLEKSEKPIFRTGHLFVYKCHNFLNDGPNEMIHYVTGIQTEDTRVLSEIVQFEIASRSPVHVTGDIASAANSLIMLEEHGYKLHAWFHTHPGKGPNAVYPSSIDIKHQTALEKAGYAVIGGIFTRDGYVRFFSCDYEFELQMHGTQITQIEPMTFKFEV